MTFEVKISEQANSDLREIFEYIAFELRSPQDAAGQLDRLERNILSLERLPERFHTYQKEPWHSRGLRVMPVDNYLVFYVTNRNTATVTIVRIMYGGRDINAQLKKHTKL